MAQSTITNGTTLIIPGAYPSITVQTSNSGLAANGVIMLVGEANAGPDYTLESDITLNGYGPDQFTDVVAKYKSGDLVDAFKAASRPANDPGIVGNPSRIFILKTNASGRASATLPKIGGGTYTTIADKSWGKLGNVTYIPTITAATPEIVPTTGLFTFIPPSGTVNTSVVVNGGTIQSLSFAAATLPSAVTTAINGLTGITATGGVDRTVLTNLTGTPTVSVTGASGNSATFNIAGKATWDITPSVGDTLYIITDFAAANRGGYVVTAATSTTISATKIADVGGTPGAPTPPTNAGAFTITAATNFRCFSPISASLAAGNVIDGIGKSLEWAELTTGTDLVSRNVLQLSATPVTFFSKVASPNTIVSASEYSTTFTVTRQSDNTSDVITAGGDVTLKIGYKGTTGTVTINSTQLTTTVTGGAGTNLVLNLKDFNTLNDLAAFINAQTGYSCSVGNATLGQLPTFTASTNTVTTQYGTLDSVTTVGIATVQGTPTGRIKKDGYAFFNKILNNTQAIQVGTGIPGTGNAPIPPALGLPATTIAAIYLAGGTLGGTSNAQITGAVDACEKIRGNFIVPLFSQDASLDIPQGSTDSSSTYTVDSINAYIRGHVLALSTLKRKKNRQAFLSKRDTFANAQLAASNIASYRCAMPFQDVKNVDAFGNIQQYQPWMGAVVAAGMQAAAFYKAILNKGANIVGALQATGDYSDQSDSNNESALTSGLMPLQKSQTGAWKWLSDQTTYGSDNNFVFNSVQAIYVADVIALTTAQRMQDAFLGESVADVSAVAALSFIEGVMDDFLRLKLIAASDDAPLGYKNIIVKISGPSMVVSLEVKLAGAIYFIPINFLVSQVSQQATSGQ